MITKPKRYVATKSARRRNQTPVDGVPWSPPVFNDPIVQELLKASDDKWAGLTDEQIKALCAKE